VDILIKIGNGINYRSYLLSLVALGSESNNKTRKDMSVENSWKKLFSYWEKDKNSMQKIDLKCSGATDIEIDRLKELYDNIPNKYIDSLKICNPTRDENHNYHSWIDKSGWGYLYDINKIISTADTWKEVEWFSKTGIYYDYVFGNVKNPKSSAKKQWIPIYDWNGDYTVAIDMFSKNKGQIIVFCTEDGTLAKWTDSYEEWFELAIDEVLKYGELRVETIEAVLALAIDKT